jgi:hypothetical protein
MYQQKGVIHVAEDVLCEVQNCLYWAKGNKCAADRIYIVSHAGKMADNEKETDCQTFEPHK